MIFTYRLRRIRDEADLSQADIQRRTGLSLDIVSSVEAGEIVPSLEMLELWATALSVPLERLFYDSVPPERFENLPGRLNADQIARASGLTIRIRQQNLPLGSAEADPADLTGLRK